LQQRTSAKVGKSDCEQTLARTRRNDELAPTPAIRGIAGAAPRFDPLPTFARGFYAYIPKAAASGAKSLNCAKQL
jgi:hypothetical protein